VKSVQQDECPGANSADFSAAGIEANLAPNQGLKFKKSTFSAILILNKQKIHLSKNEQKNEESIFSRKKIASFKN
jgi:hypothetical protein